MRLARISEAVVLVMLASLPALAQRAGATANENGTATAGGKQLSSSASAGSTANARSGSVKTSGTTNSAAAGEQMRPVNGELQSKLDSKSAKAGDEVVVNTIDDNRRWDCDPQGVAAGGSCNYSRGAQQGKHRFAIGNPVRSRGTERRPKFAGALRDSFSYGSGQRDGGRFDAER